MWVDLLVVLGFSELSHLELRKEFILVSSDVEATLLIAVLGHFQKFGGNELPAQTQTPAFIAIEGLEDSDDGSTCSSGGASCYGGTVRSSARTVSRGVFDSINFETATNFLEAMTAPIWEAFSSAPSAPNLAEGERIMALASENELSEEWQRLIQGRELSDLSHSELRALFALGECIPWQYRMALWSHWLCHSSDDMEGCGTELAQNPGEEWFKQINKDVPRTRPSELDEAKCTVLKHVLQAYAVRTPSVGYCQGMNFVVAVEVLVGFTENQALKGLSSLINKFCRGYFEHSISGLLRDVAVLDALLLSQLPLIHARFVEIGLPLIWIAAEPLLTLFSRELESVDSVCRLWDYFLVEGVCAPFAVFLAYVELAHERNFLGSSNAEDALGPFRSVLGDASVIASGLFRRASVFLAPKPYGGGLDETLLEKLREEVLVQNSEPPIPSL